MQILHTDTIITIINIQQMDTFINRVCATSMVVTFPCIRGYCILLLAAISRIRILLYITVYRDINSASIETNISLTSSKPWLLMSQKLVSPGGPFPNFNPSMDK